MKQSHFQIGKPGADMTNPKPVPPIESTVAGPIYDISEQKKRLGKASWTVGQSPMIYESTTQGNFLNSEKLGKTAEF